LAKRELNNWHPVVTLEEGLKKTIDYFSKMQVISKFQFIEGANQVNSL